MISVTIRNRCQVTLSIKSKMDGKDYLVCLWCVCFFINNRRIGPAFARLTYNMHTYHLSPEIGTLSIKARMDEKKSPNICAMHFYCYTLYPSPPTSTNNQYFVTLSTKVWKKSPSIMCYECFF